MGRGREYSALIKSGKKNEGVGSKLRAEKEISVEDGVIRWQ